MTAPLISGALCQLNILPLNAANQVVTGFSPGPSDITLTDDISEGYPIQGLTWNGGTNVGTLTFLAPVTAVQETRTLSMKLDGVLMNLLPNPLQVSILPAFGGKSILGNAWLAWDMGIPNGTTSQLGDYSGNNNYAVQTGLSNFAVPSLGSGTTIWLSATRSTTIGRLAFSFTPTLLASGAPTLNGASLGSFPSSGVPFQTISTIFLLDETAGTANQDVCIWDYKFTDAGGNTRELSLHFNSYGYGQGTGQLRLDAKYNGTSYPGVILVNSGSFFGTQYQIALLTLVLNTNGSATLYFNGASIGTAANAWGTSVPVPSFTGSSTLTGFSGLGYGSVGSQAQSSNYGQLELVAYTSQLQASDVLMNASAWNLV